MHSILKYSLFMLAMGLSLSPYTVNARVLPIVEENTNSVLDYVAPAWAQAEADEQAQDDEEVQEEDDGSIVVAFENNLQVAFDIHIEEVDGANLRHYGKLEAGEQQAFRLTPTNTKLLIFSRTDHGPRGMYEVKYTFSFQDLSNQDLFDISSGEHFDSRRARQRAREETDHNPDQPEPKRRLNFVD